MFAFSVICKTTGAVGSVVSPPIVVNDKLTVAVMWDDDFSFSQVPLEDIVGNPINMPTPGEVVPFPGGDDDHGTH